jgi:hypothetical protein
MRESRKESPVDLDRFDRVARDLAFVLPRRFVLATSLASLLGLNHRAGTDAKRQRRGQRAKGNDFGCLDVGKPCRGRDGACCSGICHGKKPMRGKRDRSRCVGHHVSGCTPERSFCATGDESGRCGPGNEFCLATTGKAGFCASFDSSDVPKCRVCRKDTDCEALFGPGAACVILAAEFCAGTDGCVGKNGSSGTACFKPAATPFVP